LLIGLKKRQNELDVSLSSHPSFFIFLFSTQIAVFCLLIFKANSVDEINVFMQIAMLLKLLLL